MKRRRRPAPLERWWSARADQPLRRRLPRLFVFAASLTALLSLVALLTVALWFEDRRTQGEAEELARTIAFALEAPLAFGDLQAAHDTLAVLRVRSNVRGAWVRDATGQVRARYLEAGLNDNTAPRPGFGRLVVTAPVSPGGQALGSVTVELDELQSYRQLAVGGAALILAQLLALMVSLPLVRRIAARITGPMTALGRTAARIAEQRDYSRRLEGEGRDEVGQAVRAFNEMLDQVQQRDEALAHANRTLEERVAQRTQELAQEKERAEAASLAKTRFLANMSHELRTPLNAVLGATQLLQQGGQASHRAQLIETIGQSGANLLALIENVLDVARIESGALTLSQEAFNLVDCVEAAVATASVAARAGGLAMAAIIHPTLGAWRLGDPMRLRQVLLNLLGNAVKFTPAGQVVLRVTAPMGAPGWVCFSVADTGVGMDLDATRDIFQPFAQADEATTRRFGGTGLGLTISRELVRAMGGDIAVDSQPGVGSTFRFEVPLPAADAADAAAAEPAQPRPVAPLYFFEPHEPSAEALAAMLQRMQVPAERVTDAQWLHDRLAAVQAAGDEAPWLLVATESAQAWALLERCADTLDPERVIAMNDAPSHAADRAREHLQLPRSVLKPVLRAALVSRLGWRRDGPPPDTAEPPSAAPPLGLPALRLLVVDDDPTNQMIVTAMLANAGLGVQSADDGRSALALLRQHRFDLVLMDWQMPDMDGLEVTRRIRNGVAGTHNATIPVVALTANAFAEDRAACLAVGMNDFLTKPVVAQQLLNVVHRWTAQAQSQAQTRQPAA
ncbi:ATP-binding protein [uncultured Aquincola sp.]|uniref:ATP-binding protein n=1 Tax=uncultured Aquincola sp. TaxID=886556 RepID=UPI0032B17A85